MKAVVHRVVPLHVPAIIVLVHAVTMNPDDRRVFFCAIQILGHEQPPGHWLSIRTRETYKLRLDKLRFVDARRHRVGQAYRLGIGFCLDRIEIPAVPRVRVLVHQVLIIGGPVRFDVRPVSCRDVRYRRVSGIAGHVRDADMTVAGAVRLISVERYERAVVRPSRAPSFKVSLG